VAETAGGAEAVRGAGTAGGSDHLLPDRVFSRGEITGVRHAVAGHVAAAGLDGDRLDGFVPAVDDIITNVVLHADGQGRIRLWLSAGAVRCEVTDRGSGIPDRYPAGDELPPAFAVGGRGIWLAHQLCDRVRVETGGSGSTVVLMVTLSGRPGRAELSAEAVGPRP
jgi:anti-sigma regulatory factor (Ser/Thr protein kinase)